MYNLNNLKSKADKLDVDKLVPLSVDSTKNYVTKMYVYNSKIKHIEDKVPDTTNLATNTTLNANINEVKGEIPSITYLATTAALTAVENEIPNTNNLVKKLTQTQKLVKLKRKLRITIMINILLFHNLIS